MMSSTLSRRGFGLGAAFAAFAAPALAQNALPRPVLSAAEQALLARCQASLQAIASVRGTFTETGAGGQRRQGRFWLQRPGKMRFEYTDPAGLLVVSDGYNVKRYDPRLNVFRQVPLGATPLSVFLSRSVRFDQGVQVDRVRDIGNGAIAVTARDARRPSDGVVTMTFGGSPLRLWDWTITDAQGARTRTQLTSLVDAPNLSRSLFQLSDPTRRPGRN